jgi:alpha-L-fucosidase 2
MPDELKTGKVKGLKARGGYRIDMEWKDGELKKAEIYGGKDCPVPAIRLQGKFIDLTDSGIVKFKRPED